MSTTTRGRHQPSRETRSSSFALDRRAALKLFTSGAALALASCGRPAEEIVPYVELPERLVDALEIRARQLHSTVEAVAVEAIEKDMNKVETGTVPGRRVQLPLIRSAKPGSLRSLTNAEIDGILG